MKELAKLDLSGLQPLDEGLLSEADMLEVLGGRRESIPLIMAATDLFVLILVISSGMHIVELKSALNNALFHLF